MYENGVNQALRRLNYGSPKMTAHGWSARTSRELRPSLAKLKFFRIVGSRRKPSFKWRAGNDGFVPLLAVPQPLAWGLD